jgi:predicted metalloprotease with PDZ domain
VLGVKTANEGDNVKLTQVLDHGAAQRAGLSAGDVLVALDNLRITAISLDNCSSAASRATRSRSTPSAATS